MTAISKHYAEIGRKGGQVTSQAKATAARQNARNGGKPRSARVVLDHARRHIENSGAIAFLMEDDQLSAWYEEARKWLAAFAKRKHQLNLEE